MLACRLCRVPLHASKGCASCNDLRRNIVVVGEDEAEAPGLAGTSNEVVAALRTQARRLREKLADGDDATVERRLLAIGNTTAKVLESARKLRADAVGALEGMSFEERAELFLLWYGTLPPQYRDALRFKMDSFEMEVSEPVTEDRVDGNN